MENILMIRYGEIHLKGRNKAFFEKCFLENIKKAIHDIPCKIIKIQCRVLIEDFEQSDTDRLIYRLKTVLGAHSISLAYKVDTDLEKIAKVCINTAPENGSFRITVNRADKSLSKNSQEIARLIGGKVLVAHPQLKVDLFNPNKEIIVDIRENKMTYIYFSRIMCFGGMPVGSSGSGMVLLSGGIDSPVAAFRMAKRGMKIKAVHFHSFPFTSLQAQEKVLDIAKKLSIYCGDIPLFIVPFTEIQQSIHRECPSEFMITIMRRFMMRIAERLALHNNCTSITTGESLAQVASQTQDSILVINSVIKKLPIFRPLIGMDKEEIIKTAREIDTFNLSILPYEDCCTVFLPKNPVICPKLNIIEGAESKLDVENLIQNAMDNMEIKNIITAYER